MSISMYQTSVPVFISRMEKLSGILQKGEDYAKSKDIAPEVFLSARLRPDMHDLTRQIQLSTSLAAMSTARLGGQEVPEYEGFVALEDQSFAALYGLLDKAIAFTKSGDSSKIDGSEEREISFGPGGKVKYPGQQYLLSFALPKFFFHVTTAYAILRLQGVELRMGDFL